MELLWTETSQLNKAIKFINNFKKENPKANKQIILKAFEEMFYTNKKRSLYVCDNFCIRFCEVNTNNFSGTVLSLSALKEVDDIPVIICLVKTNEIVFLLGNSTFIKKVSHSSHKLSINNIKGSFNGSDIMTNCFSLKNEIDNFERLFAIHKSYSWEENVFRISNQNNKIKATNFKFKPSDLEKEIILNSYNLSKRVLEDNSIKNVENYLNQKINRKQEQLFKQALNNNSKLRGDNIEKIITENKNFNNLADLNLKCNNYNFFIDIKSHIVGQNSSPKAYNIDKMLSCISKPNNIFLLYFLQIDIMNNKISTKLLSVYDNKILDYTGIQFHWSGRDSRGATQLSNNYHKLINDNYKSDISLEKAEKFLDRLLVL